MSSTDGWAILTTRYGGETRRPSRSELAHAADELFEENLNGMTEADYAEHPNAWVRYGLDDGPEYVVEADRYRTVTFLKYGDQDDADPLAEYSVQHVTKDGLLSIWQILTDGEIERIGTMYPGCGW